MPASSKIIPFSLIGLGGVLILAAFLVPTLLQSQTAAPGTPIPAQVVGMSLGTKMTGKAALAEFDQLHGQTIAAVSGAKATYGSVGQVSLWVAQTESGEAAGALLVQMRDKIAERRSPFSPTGELTVQGRNVYTLDGMGQKHFYFQSGKYVIWLASSADRANDALIEIFNFYR